MQKIPFHQPLGGIDENFLIIKLELYSVKGWDSMSVRSSSSSS
jgi:hypothetical protein